jgi:hypothetical protein
MAGGNQERKFQLILSWKINSAITRDDFNQLLSFGVGKSGILDFANELNRFLYKDGGVQ